MLDRATVDDLRALPNVAAVDTRVQHAARVTVGDHLPEQATVWGLDLDGATVDVVKVDQGAAPAAGEILVDDANGARAPAATSGPATG